MICYRYLLYYVERARPISLTCRISVCDFITSFVLLFRCVLLVSVCCFGVTAVDGFVFAGAASAVYFFDSEY